MDRTFCSYWIGVREYILMTGGMKILEILEIGFLFKKSSQKRSADYFKKSEKVE